MKRTLMFTGLAALLCAVPLANARAEEKKPEVKQEVGPTMDAKETANFSQKVDLFVQVASYGETQKDPLALVTAVRMLDELPFGGVAKAGEGDKSGPPYDRDALLNLAKEAAAGDAGLLAIIQKLQDAPEPTAVRGGWRHPPGPDRYWERRYHERRYRCRWFRVCRHGNCEWVCR